MTKQLELYTTHFKQLNKRLMMQPITLKAVENDSGCTVKITTDEGITSFLHHLVNMVSEHVVSDVISAVFREQGAYPDWASERLIPRLQLDGVDAPWKEELGKELAQYVENSLETQQPFKLDAYMAFRTQHIREKVKGLASELEELTFYGVVERTLSALQAEMPEQEALTGTSIEIVGKPTDMLFLLEQEGEEQRMEVVNTSDFVGEVANFYAEMVYIPDSDRYKEAQFYIYTLLMMSRWDVKHWIVPDEVFPVLERYRSRLDIPVIIN